MVENVKQNPDIWEEKFPNHQRRSLVRALVRGLATIAGIEKIFLEETVSAGRADQWIYVFAKSANGDPAVPDGMLLEKTNEVFWEICAEQTSLELMCNRPPLIVTEFYYHQESLRESGRKRKISVLWQKSG